MPNSMAPSDGQIINSIGNETVFGDITVGPVIRVGIKWVVGDSPKAGVRGVQCAALLIEIRVGHIQHEAAPVAPCEFGLEGVGVCMPEVSVGEQKLPDQGEGQSSQVRRRVGTVSL